MMDPVIIVKCVWPGKKQRLVIEILSFKDIRWVI